MSKGVRTSIGKNILHPPYKAKGRYTKPNICESGRIEQTILLFFTGNV
jgi:hypothetical protein